MWGTGFIFHVVFKTPEEPFFLFSSRDNMSVIVVVIINHSRICSVNDYFVLSPFTTVKTYVHKYYRSHSSDIHVHVVLFFRAETDRTRYYRNANVSSIRVRDDVRFCLTGVANRTFNQTAASTVFLLMTPLVLESFSIAKTPSRE